IDTLSTTAGELDTDRSSELMSQMLKPLKVIAKKNDTAIAVVHHNKKSATEQKGSRAGNDMLGSVALHAWVDCAIYARAKDSSGVHIERESKMAQDESLTISIPHMYESLATGSRQLWDPELSVNVGQEQPVHTENNGGQAKKPSTAGKTLALKLKRIGGGPLSAEDIAYRLGDSPSMIKKQLREGVENGYVYEDEGKYTVSSDL